MNQRINESTNQRINESTNQRIEARNAFGWRGRVRLFVYELA